MPQAVIDEILGRLAGLDLGSLRSCALVSRSWAPSSRRHLLHTVTFTWLGMERWLKTFPVPEESPAHLVSDLSFRIGGSDRTPEKFFEYIPWFTNVERVTLSSRQGMSQPLKLSWYWRFPQTATSLTISADSVTITQIRNIMLQLPNLDDLSLSGAAVLHSEPPPGYGTDPRWRFCGKLQLHGMLAGTSSMNLLLENPTSLRFTEVEICCLHNSLLSTVRLVEACSKSLVKLSYKIALHHGKAHPFSCSGWF